MIDAYRAVRARTTALAARLSPEDQMVQSMPDASPTKWHLAHTSWFFETFLLQPCLPGYRLFRERFGYLFNSYYDAVGARVEREARGLLTRPSLAEVHDYRTYVDQGVAMLLAAPRAGAEVEDRIALGLAHEEQHQELLLTDIKHAFWQNPLRPPYVEPRATASTTRSVPMGWTSFPEGLAWIGHEGQGFSFDNERPRHRVFLHAFSLATRSVSCGEYLAFIEDGGYTRPTLWLSDGWQLANRERWRAPLYWEQIDGRWWQFTLSGMRPLVADEPVCHVSYFEADAFARWAGARLATEAEWERDAGNGAAGTFLEADRYHPGGPDGASFLGDVWEWTQSPYGAYPGYRPPSGALGEYNGKFMSGQYVLRGGSCVTPRSHIRPSYRNFFPPSARWQFSGIRLAKDA